MKDLENSRTYLNDSEQRKKDREGRKPNSYPFIFVLSPKSLIYVSVKQLIKKK